MFVTQSLATTGPPRQLPSVVRPKLRERIPTSRHPNFRDHGKMVDTALLRALCKMQRKHGIAWFSEAGIRKWLCEDTGHMPGVGTIPKALDRLEADGILRRDWCTRGSIKPDGEKACEGCMLVMVPQARIAPKVARELVARTPQERIVHGRINPQRIHELRARMGAIAPRLAATDDRAAALERKRADDAQRLRDLAAQWERENRGPPK